MASYIVRKIAATKDGSSMGPTQTHVSAASELEAKKLGADQLGVSQQHVEAVPYANPHWGDLRD